MAHDMIIENSELLRLRYGHLQESFCWKLYTKEGKQKVDTRPHHLLSRKEICTDFTEGVSLSQFRLPFKKKKQKTKKHHRLSGLNNRHLDLTLLEARKSKIKVLACLVSRENLLPGLKTAMLSLYFHTAERGSSGLSALL